MKEFIKRKMLHLAAKVTGDAFLSTTPRDDFIKPVVDRSKYSTWKRGEVFYTRDGTSDGMTVVAHDFNPFQDEVVKIVFVKTAKEFVDGMDTIEVKPHEFMARWRRDSNDLVITAAGKPKLPCNLKEF